MRVMDADVIVVGAGPTGLMLAAELRLAGARPLVLERRPTLRETPKANGFSGQILELLRHRGLLDRFEAVSTGPIHPAPGIPFGGVQVDLTRLADSPLHVLGLPQPRLERVLDERAGELGVVIRRGHEVVGLSQDDTAVTADVRGPDGPYRVRAGYLVGCDGGHSRIRELAGIPFPGVTYPEVNRLGQVTAPDDLELQPGFTRTDRGVFAVGWLAAGVLLVQTTEDELSEVDDEKPMTLGELQESIRRVLGADFLLGEPLRLSRYQFQARQARRYRDGRILLAGDAAHQFPATGIGINTGMLDAVNLGWKLAADLHGWAPAGLLDTYHDERHFAGARAMVQTQAQAALRRGDDPAAEALRELFLELLADEQPLRHLAALIAGDLNPRDHTLTGRFVPDLGIAELLPTARPVFLDLADRPDLREIARDWAHRVDLRTAETDHRPADALLIRPDGYVAWAATTGESADGLRDALAVWFGSPR